MASKKVTIVTCDNAINEIDKQIEVLKSEKTKLIAERFTLLKDVKETPLHQLNLVSRLGVKKAKETLGKNWVE